MGGISLTKNNLSRIEFPGLVIPDPGYFQLPEKVLQFGTGVLLRGLPDYFIDKANRQGIFNGRIVVVKSTDGGDHRSFDEQDNLYTTCIRGVKGRERTEKNIINASISRVLSSEREWAEILDCAGNPEMRVIISNTTEVGIVLSDDAADDAPPASFPGKLLAFLHRRYTIFRGDPSKGCVIIPTELVPDNAALLFSILRQMAERWQLGPDFTDWLKNANYFCNSLVDCIVPGKKAGLAENMGYTDELLVMTEVYRLWAIQSSSPEVSEILSFAKTDDRVVIAPDIHLFRELKLRLLNGPHSFSCALAIMSGFSLVRQAFDAPEFYHFVRELMMEEVIPVISDDTISAPVATDFANQLLDRFRNPYLDHQWMSISLQYSMKMRLRNVPLISRFISKFGEPPVQMSLGFAAFLLFMKPNRKADGKYYGFLNGHEYEIRDEQASLFASAWEIEDQDHFLQHILQNQDLWGTDLSALPGFSAAVQQGLQALTRQGARTTLQQLARSKKVAE
jgi:tagaturonate reductase